MIQLTKKQAWEKIAQAFEAAGNGLPHDARITQSGLCHAAIELYRGPAGGEPDVAYWLLQSDTDEVENFQRAVEEERGTTYDDPDRMGGGWWWPRRGERRHTPAADFERAMMAQLLAESAED